MRRKEFIQKLGLATAGITLMPSVLFSEPSSRIVFYDLPELQNHVRHSGFMETYNSKNTFPESSVVQVKSRDLLFKNGFNSSENDLQVISFSIHDEAFCLQSGKKETVLFNKNQEIKLINNKPLKVGDSTFTLITFANEISLEQQAHSSYVLPLFGEILVDNTNLKNKLMKTNTDVKLNCFNNSSFLFIF